MYTIRSYSHIRVDDALQLSPRNRKPYWLGCTRLFRSRSLAVYTRGFGLCENCVIPSKCVDELMVCARSVVQFLSDVVIVCTPLLQSGSFFYAFIRAFARRWNTICWCSGEVVAS